MKANEFSKSLSPVLVQKHKQKMQEKQAPMEDRLAMPLVDSEEYQWSFGPQSSDDLSDVTPDIKARIKNWD